MDEMELSTRSAMSSSVLACAMSVTDLVDEVDNVVHQMMHMRQDLNLVDRALLDDMARNRGNDDRWSKRRQRRESQLSQGEESEGGRVSVGSQSNASGDVGGGSHCGDNDSYAQSHDHGHNHNNF